MPLTRSRGAWVALLLALHACSGGDQLPDAGRAAVDAGAPVEAVWFREEALARGLDFQHVSGQQLDRYLMPENVCGGAALFDADADGDLDAYLIQSGVLVGDRAEAPGNQLFLNAGGGVFEDASTDSGADHRGYGMGVACGDVDGDGLVDLYVTNTGPNTLLANGGGGRFLEITSSAGVGDPGFGSSAGFVDYDRDGDLDLLTVNYVHWSVDSEIDCFNDRGAPDYCSPQTYDSPAGDVLYNNSGSGVFADVTEEAGLTEAIGTGLGVGFGDFNSDGWVDLFVANDGMPDHLWVNRADGTFREDAFFAGCAVDQDGRPKAGMGVSVADVDDDGDLDLLVCNLAGQTDSFFRNEGGAFHDSTGLVGLGVTSRPFTRFGMAWVDFDQDGHLDLFQANGRVNRKSRDYGPDPLAEPNLVFRKEDGRFREVLPRGGTENLLVGTSRAAAFGDVDGDGGVDILICNRDGPAHLLINSISNRGGWILFTPTDRGGGPALGATVTFRAGERTIVRDAQACFSYQASNDPRVHAGLGEATRVEDVVVRWSDGARESFGGFDAGGVITLARGAGAALD